MHVNGVGFGFYPRFRAVPVGRLQSPRGLVAGGGAKVLPDSTSEASLMREAMQRPTSTGEMRHR